MVVKNSIFVFMLASLCLSGCTGGGGDDDDRVGATGNFLTCQQDDDCTQHPDAVRCGDDGYCVDARGARVSLVTGLNGEADSIVGPWSSVTPGMWLCVRDDGKVWAGDSQADLAGPASCELVLDGTAPRIACHGEDPDDIFTAEGELHPSGLLELRVVDCPPGEEGCAADYLRGDDGNRCALAEAARGQLGARCHHDTDCKDGASCIVLDEGACRRECGTQADCPDGTACFSLADGEPFYCVRDCDVDGCDAYGSTCEWFPSSDGVEPDRHLCL